MLSLLWKHRFRTMLASVAVLILSAGTLLAAQWNERTRLTFSEPVMVPGATLPAGTYIFRLTDSRSNRHLVEIAKENGEVITVTQAVPMKRQDAKGDLVVKFNPTEDGAAAAIAGWYYPGSRYGHHFVYPDDQAKVIAERTKTLVISTDVPGTDLERGKLRVYDASGVAKDWQPDSATSASWEEWQTNRKATAGVVAETTTGDRAQATAPAMQADAKGMRIPLDNLESNSQQYIGKTVTVDAEVEEVFGPRVFKIDEPNWGDLDGEILVYVPTNLAALVREDDRVTVTGTVKRFVSADFENEWGWLGVDDTMEVKLGKRPVVVANHIVGGDSSSVLVVDVRPNTDRSETATNTAGTKSGDTAVATSGTTGAARSAMTDISALGRGGDNLVGRHVSLDGVRIEAMAKNHGFFARAGDDLVFVLPAVGEQTAAGSNVSVEGVVLQMPRHMKNRLAPPAGRTLNDEIYIFATHVKR